MLPDWSYCINEQMGHEGIYIVQWCLDRKEVFLDAIMRFKQPNNAAKLLNCIDPPVAVKFLFSVTSKCSSIQTKGTTRKCKNWDWKLTWQVYATNIANTNNSTVALYTSRFNLTSPQNGSFAPASLPPGTHGTTKSAITFNGWLAQHSGIRRP